MTLIKPTTINDELTYNTTPPNAATTMISTTPTDYTCYKCKIPCKRGDPNVIRAVGNIYHRQCFRCDFCNISVLSKFYVFDHHRLKHTPTLAAAASSIATELDMLENTLRRHSNHSNSSNSSNSSSSSDSTFHDAVEGDEEETDQKSTLILCEQDYYQHSQLKCHQCNELITNDDYVVLSVYKYHKHCLKCPGCTIVRNNSYSNMATTAGHVSNGNNGILLEGMTQPSNMSAQEIYDYDGRPYCRYHFSMIKGTECGGCGQAILHHYKGREGGPKWHSECYMIQKYWHVRLIELEDRNKPQAGCKNREEVICKQNQYASLRTDIWRELSQYEDATSKLISNIIILNQSREYQEEYTNCRTLYKQLSVLFTVLDSLFAYQQMTNLACDVPVQILSDYLAYFFDILCQYSPSTNSSDEHQKPELTASANTLIKMASILSQCVRDLIKLCLQQSILLERKFGQENAVIQQMLSIFTNQQYRKVLDISCLDHNLQLIDMAITRLGLVLNIEKSVPSSKNRNDQPSIDTLGSSKRTEEAVAYKAPTIKVKNNNINNSNNRASTFSSGSPTTFTKMLGSSSSSAMNLHYLSRKLSQDTTFSTASSPTSVSSGFTSSLRRNRSSRLTSKNADESQTKSSSRMETIRRAFTTSRPKGLKVTNTLSTTSIPTSPAASTLFLLQNHRREQKRSVSVYGQGTPLNISLPDVKQLDKYQTAIPLSPPSASLTSLRERRRGCSFNFTERSMDAAAVCTYLPELTEEQDTIIRHMAALYIETHVDDDSFNLNDLMSLINTAVTDTSTMSSTCTSASPTSSRKAFPSSATALWERLKSHIVIPNSNNDASDQHSVSSPTSTVKNGEHRKLGVSLSNISNSSLTSLLPHQPQYVEHHSNSFENWKTNCPSVAACFSSKSLIPNFLKDCILAMITQDITTEGIFRKNGNIRGLKDMCEQLDSEPFREDWSHFFMNQPIIQSAAFIKRFLRELPEPLLTFRLYTLFLLSYKVAAATGTEEDDATAALQLIHYGICLLPKANRDILLATLALLNWVARYSAKNKMTVQNLARVMAPNILYSMDNNSNSASGLTTISSTYSNSSLSRRRQQSQQPDLKDVSMYHGEIWVVATMIEHFEELVKVPTDITLLLKHPKMSETLFAHSIDLTSSKHFIRAFGRLLEVKNEVVQQQNSPPVSTTMAAVPSCLPSSPSIAAQYHS